MNQRKEFIGAKFYARAIFPFAKKQGVDLWMDFLSYLEQVFSAPFAIDWLIADTSSSKEEKTKYILESYYSFTSTRPAKEIDYLKSFLSILVSHNRYHLVSEIKEELQNIVDKNDGIIHVIVETASDPDAKTKSYFKKFLPKLCGSEKLRVDYIKNNSLILGFNVNIGDKIFKVSLKNDLSKLFGNNSL